MDELSKSMAELLGMTEKAVSRLARPLFDGKDAVYSRFGAATGSALPFRGPARQTPLRPAVKI